ncbi:MAG: lysophospholipid acyltransferase family protein [Planctomycetota bacterium]|nr:lysophospholipid acyltransferase family protein [Planctomycetota bacterium]
MRRNRLVYTVSRFAMLCVSKVWFRLRTEGSAHLPSDGPVLLVGNHSSYLDPPLMGMGVGRQVNFLAQAGLGSFGPLRWWLRQVGVTLIDRDAPSKDAMRWVGGRLKAGEVVGIFPEGTRSGDGRVMPFKGGVEFLVRRSKATVVPVGIDGAFRAYPRRAWFPRPRKVIVRVGEPWSAEQVLAAGGVEALRRRVAELARAPLSVPDAAEIDPDHSRPSASAAATPSSPQNQPVEGDA